MGGKALNTSQPLDGFESPRAFTFQYYLTVTPATVDTGGLATSGYQYHAGCFVTNELVGPAVYFRMDIDPIRVTYFSDSKPWASFAVTICALVGGCVALLSVLVQFLEGIEDLLK